MMLNNRLHNFNGNACPLQQQLLIRRKLFESSNFLHSTMLGQDRYKRRYWALPQCGGVFVEGTVSREGKNNITFILNVTSSLEIKI